MYACKHRYMTINDSDERGIDTLVELISYGTDSYYNVLHIFQQNFQFHSSIFTQNCGH